MLKFKDYSLSVEKKKILQNINLSFEKGKIYVLMGPNGSGKSTLALSVAGSPGYTLSTQSRLTLERKEISKLSPEKRSALGLFVSFQSPPSISGVSVFQFLRVALSKKYKPLDLRKKIQEIAKELHISDELLTRPLNEGFSGGERKKMEVLQLALIDPQIAFLDEIDTGVDVDALRVIFGFLQKFMSPHKTIVLITHHSRILKYIQPDEVVVMKNGSVVKTGGVHLIREIERSGYDQY